MRREWPWTVAQAGRMAADVADTPVPWKFCLDWGHATFRAAVRQGIMQRWANGFETLAPHIGMVHLQQTDFQFDRHWDFTETGAVIPKEAARQQRKFGLGDQAGFP